MSITSLFEIHDEREFSKIVALDAQLDLLATGMPFTEGPIQKSLYAIPVLAVGAD